MHDPQKYLKVEGKNNLFRDKDTNAIINTDSVGYQSYIANRDKLLSEKERIDNLENQIMDIKEDLGDIKDLLLKAFKEA